jgi:hypothetical protein
MINSTLEQSLADFLAAWLNRPGFSEIEVRPALCPDELPPFVPVVIVQVAGIEHEVGPLRTATVVLRLQSPARQVGLSRHRELAAVLGQTLTPGAFPAMAAAVFEGAAADLVGHFEVSNQSGEDGGEFFTESQVRLALMIGDDALLNPDHAAIPGGFGPAAILAALFPAGFVSYFGGDCRFVDARAGAVRVTLPAAEFQAAVRFNAGGLLDSLGAPLAGLLSPAAAIPHDAATVTFPAGAFGVVGIASKGFVARVSAERLV